MTRKTPITFETIKPENAEIRETIHAIYGTPRQQAGNVLALVVIALFCSTVAMLAAIFVGN